MSVIGKMSVSEIAPFSDGVRVKLNAQCVDALMAHYHPENEDVAFTKYSPSADTVFQFPVGFTKFEKPDGSDLEKGKMYFVYQKSEERPSIEGAAFFMQLRVVSATAYGGLSKMVELCNPYASSGYEYHAREARQGNLKLGIDNPPAADQFVPGESGWWVVAYRADELTQEAALKLARA